MINNLFNINGEYVKFYITTNSNIPAILKNSGSIVIYNDKNNLLSNQLLNTSYALNYIYIGNEIIASGFGLSSIELRNKAEQIAVNYDDRQLYIDSYIDKFSYDITYLENTTLRITSNISSTCITSFENEKFLTKNLLFNTINSKYKEAIIEDEKTTIEYFVISNPKNYYNKYGVTAEQISIANDTASQNVITYSNEPIKLPIGAKIKSFKKEFKIKLNDESGIYFDNFLMYAYLPQEICVSNSFNDKKYQYNKINNILSYTSNINDFTIKKDYSNIISDNTKEQFYVKEGLTYLTYNMLIQTKGTGNDKLSYYTFYDSKLNTYTLSKENAILPHALELNPIIIEGCPVLYSYQCNTDEESISFANNLAYGAYGEMTLLEDITKLTIKSTTYTLYLGLPENSFIDEIYYIDNDSNTKINITGMFVDLDINNPFKKYPYIKDNNNYEYMNYKIYSLNYINNDTFGNDLDIYIKTSNNILSKSNNNITDDITPDIYKWTTIQNENYMVNNWISCKSSNNKNTFLNLIGENKKYYTKNDVIFNNPFKYWDKLYNLIEFDELSNKYINLIDTKLNLTINSEYLIIPKEYAEKCQFIYNNEIFSLNNLINNKYIELNKFKKLDSEYYKIRASGIINSIVYNEYIYLSKTVINIDELYNKLIHNGYVLDSSSMVINKQIKDIKYIYLPYNYKLQINYKNESKELKEIKLLSVNTMDISITKYTLYTLHDYNLYDQNQEIEIHITKYINI